MAEIPPLALMALAFILGAMLGSFLNVVIYRLPLMLDRAWRAECLDYLQLPAESSVKPISLILPSSHCPSCGHSIRPWHNIPIIGYLLLKGRCADCGAGIGIRYPFVEFLTAILTTLVVWQFGPTWQGLLAVGITWALIALTGIDLDKHLLPDGITLPLLWAGLVANSFGLFTDLYSALWGAVAGYLSLWSVFWLFKVLTGKEGMGYGDFKLLAALGAWLGWQYLPLIILLSSVVGLVMGIGMMIFMGHDRRVPIAFGPYLAIAGWICLYFGDDALAALQRVLG